VARPRKTGLSYFPMDCIWDEKAHSFESVFENDGFVWLVKFWQTAYQSEDGAVDFDGIYGVIHPKNSRITQAKHSEMLAFAINIGLIFKNSQGRYTSSGIQKRITVINKERENGRNRHKNELSGEEPPDNPLIRGERERERERKKKKSVPLAPTPRFVKPTIPEIMNYCEDRDNRVDPQKFFDFYESKGWKVGNQGMRDWRAAVRTWEKRDEAHGPGTVKRQNGLFSEE